MRPTGARANWQPNNQLSDDVGRHQLMNAIECRPAIPAGGPSLSFFYPVGRKFNFFFLPLCWALYVKRLLPCCCCWPAGAELKGPCVGSPQYSLWRPTRLLFGINNRSSPERPTGRSVSPCTCSVKRASLSV